MDSRTYIVLYEALVRPYVEYANSVWSPYKKGDGSMKISRRNPCSPFFSVTCSINRHKII